MKRLKLLILLILVMLGGTSCNNPSSDIQRDRRDERQQSVQEAEPDIYAESKEMAECYRDIYEQAKSEDTLGTLETVRNIVECIGAAGYAVVDADNQIDMVNANKLLDFIKEVDGKKRAELTLICVVTNGGFIRFDFQTSEGSVHITRSYLTWNEKTPEINSKEEYDAYTWKYSEDGYLFFEKYHMPGYDGPSGNTAVRVRPLDGKCRELNRQYILPVSYELNNMFISDWSEEDFNALDFYDIFAMLYPKVYDAPLPYMPDDNLGVGTIYYIPKEEFEKVIMLRFKIDSETLQSKTKYFEEDQSYEYRPRGLYDCEPPSYPFPEVVSYTENQDGTITLMVHVVYPDYNLSKVYAHEVVVRPLANGNFQYVSNHIIPSESNYEESWRVDRLTEEEWEEVYGGKNKEWRPE